MSGSAPFATTPVRRHAGRLLLVLPLALFLILIFFAPLAGILRLAVLDTEIPDTMPRTVAALSAWDGQGLPPAAAYDAVALDLFDARKAKTVGTIGRRLSYEATAWRSLVQTTARRLPTDIAAEPSPGRLLQGIDPAWSEPGIWQALDRAKGPWTTLHLARALDLGPGAEGEGVYLDILLRTFVIALSATAISLVLALPAAGLLATSGERAARLLMLLLLLPLWTSVLVRSAAWLVVLQKNGLVNQALVSLGITAAPLDLVYNRTGVLVALVHVLLPYAVLPLYGAMKAVPKSQMLAARSLGAGPVAAFRRVYLPQIAPGLAAGGLLVFILALGYYITPLLLGGQGDQMLPFHIAYNTLQALNWGLAAALACLLLFATVLLYAVYVRLAGVERV